MKKLTTTVLAVVLTSSFGLADAQVKKDSAKTTDIEGVVVTALGIKREKKSLGYASQEIKSDALSDGTTNTGNIAAQLSGKVAGLNVTTTSNFGGTSNLLIRGIKSLKGGNPLIVIDGSPVDNSSTYSSTYGSTYIDFGNALQDINQDDVESVNVLKGAAASALYGERGLNGVIVITTKSGRGKKDNSWGVTWSSGVTVGSIDKKTFPKYQKEYGGGYMDSFYKYSPNADGNNYANFTEDASFGPQFNPNLLVYQWDSFDTTSSNFGKATPWVAAKNDPSKFFNTAITYNNSITLEKGSKGNSILFNYENFLSNGIMPNSDLKKNQFSLKVNYDFTDKLHSSFYTTLNIQNTKGRNTTQYNDNIMSSFRQWWQTNVDVLDLKRAYFNNAAIASEANNYGNVSWNIKSPTNFQPAYWNNPYFQLYESYTSDKRYRSFSYGNLTYDIAKNISIMGKVSYDRTNLLIENRLAKGTLPTDFGSSTNTVDSGYARQDITKTETNYDVLLNYKFDITNDINVSGVVGGSVRRNYYNSVYASTEGGLVVPGLYSLSNSQKSVLAPKEDLYTTQTNSGYATASFDFYKLFYLDGTWRIDQSSTLPKGDNTYNYPSVTGSLILSELLNVNWMNFWKLRANYAEVGGTADPYQTADYYNSAGIFSGDEGGVGIYSPITTKANEALKPQRSKEFEVGTEASLFNNRLTFDVAYYKTKTLDQIISMSVSPGNGVTSKVINAGRIDNSGLEVQLGLTPIKTRDFTWQMDANWSKNRNKVVELNEGSSNLLLRSFTGGVSLNARVGQAWGALVGSDFVYDANGNKVLETVTDEDGYTYVQYKTDPNKVIGNATPDWIGGLRNTFSYKNFTLSFLIDVRQGGDIFSTDMYYGLDTGLYPETAGAARTTGWIAPGVLENGTVNTQYALGYPGMSGAAGGYEYMKVQKAYVYDGSYVKLREASISYSLPKNVLNGTFLTDAKFAIVGRNLWIIHKNLPYADPESVVGGGLYSYGWSIGSLPTTRDIGVSITVKF